MRFRTIRASNGEYSGETNWKKQPHGFGTMRFSNGDELSGTWANGKPNGHITYRYNDGDELSANCVNGVVNDRYARYYTADGQEWEMVILNDKLVSEKRVI